MESPSYAPAQMLVSDLQSVFGARLRSVVAYGPHLDGDATAPLTCLVLVDAFGLSDLEACAGLSARWTRSGIAIPLILGEDEFLKSLDAFPLEYGEIIRAHRDLLGTDPFAHVTISHADLRRACETQVKSHLLHLRESFIDARGVPKAIAELVETAAPAFAALLRNVARLAGTQTADRVAATREGARAAGISDAVVTTVLALERPSGALSADTSRFFAEYLAAVEQLSRTVDTWHVS